MNAPVLIPTAENTADEWEPDDSQVDAELLNGIWDRHGEEQGALPPPPALSQERALEYLRRHEAGELPSATELWVRALHRRIASLA